MTDNNRVTDTDELIEGLDKADDGTLIIFDEAQGAAEKQRKKLKVERMLELSRQTPIHTMPVRRR